MNSIRATVKQNYHHAATTDFWTNLRTSVQLFINANADSFEAVTRTGAPFGGNIARG